MDDLVFQLILSTINFVSSFWYRVDHATPFNRNFIKLNKFWKSLSLSLSFLCKDFSKVKGQRVAEPTNERLPSSRLTLARSTSGTAGWWHLKVPHKGIDRRARSLALSIATGDATEGRGCYHQRARERKNDMGGEVGESGAADSDEKTAVKACLAFWARRKKHTRQTV